MTRTLFACLQYRYILKGLMSTDLESCREYHVSHDPCNGAPRASKEKNIDADEGDEPVLNGKLVGQSGSDTSNYELTDCHADSAEHEERAAASYFDEVETRECGGYIDGGSNHQDDEGAINAGVLEEGSSVIDWDQMLKRNTCCVTST
jgi:hypothetical protein